MEKRLADFRKRYAVPAIAAMLWGRLVEAGAVSWQTPLGELLPDLAGSMHQDWLRTPVETLFYCRAGMRANPPLRDFRKLLADDRPLTTQRTEAAQAALAVPPKHPGRFVYSNLSYIVIGALVDRLTGLSYEEALQREVLDPLGVASAGYGPPADVCGHAGRLRLGPLAILKGPPTRRDNPPVLSSAGTLYVTPGDWAKLLRPFVTQGGGFLQPTTIRELLTGPEDYQMIKGWGRAAAAGASLGMQGSNTCWAATALMAASQDRMALVICNDGRTRVLMKSAELAGELLQLR